MPSDCAALIDQLVTLRKGRGLTQMELAKAATISQPMLARIESKRSVPQMDTLYKIIHALGCDLQVISQ